jgi:hypothetical protein
VVCARIVRLVSIHHRLGRPPAPHVRPEVPALPVVLHAANVQLVSHQLLVDPAATVPLVSHPHPVDFAPTAQLANIHFQVAFALIALPVNIQPQLGHPPAPHVRLVPLALLVAHPAVTVQLVSHLQLVDCATTALLVSIHYQAVFALTAKLVIHRRPDPLHVPHARPEPLALRVARIAATVLLVSHPQLVDLVPTAQLANIQFQVACVPTALLVNILYTPDPLHVSPVLPALLALPAAQHAPAVLQASHPQPVDFAPVVQLANIR